MKVIGLSGGVSSGKSTVAGIFRRMGAQVLSSDQIVHKNLRKGTLSYRRILKRFGPDILDRGRKISRSRLRHRVFGNKGDFNFLERVLHPVVLRTIRAGIRQFKPHRGLLVVEVPLLFEAGMNRWMDATVVVTASPDRTRRYARKRGMSMEDLKTFAKRQWKGVRKEKRADYVIRNNGSIRDLRRKVYKVYGELKTEEKG